MLCFTLRPWIVCNAIVASLLISSPTFAAALNNLTGSETNYSVTLNDNVASVTNLQLFERATNLDAGRVFGSQGGPALALGGATTQLAGFIYECPCIPDASLFGGISTDPSGQDHLILFLSEAAANEALGQAWSESFPSVDLMRLTSGFPDGSTPFSTFAFFSAEENILDDSGNPVSALFAPGENFSVMSWSSGFGSVIGSGTSEVTLVPLPATGLLLLPPVIGLGLVSRRRSSSSMKDG